MLNNTLSNIIYIIINNRQLTYKYYTNWVYIPYNTAGKKNSTISQWNAEQCINNSGTWNIWAWKVLLYFVESFPEKNF